MLIRNPGHRREAGISRRGFCAFALLLATAAAIGVPAKAWAATAAEIDAKADNALTSLYRKNAGARALADKAKGVLIFPSIVKGGFLIGGAYGQGALRVGGKSVDYYNSVAASYGFSGPTAIVGEKIWIVSASDAGWRSTI